MSKKGHSEFFSKIELFGNFRENMKTFRKFACKNRKFLSRIHGPQISNQIDATEY